MSRSTPASKAGLLGDPAPIVTFNANSSKHNASIDPIGAEVRPDATAETALASAHKPDEAITVRIGSPTRFI